MKKQALTAVVLTILTVAGTYAADVYLDGEKMNVQRIDITTSSSPGPAPPTPVPDPAPAPSECERYDRMPPDIDWASPGGRQTLNLSRPVVLAFDTTSNPHYGGYVNLFEVAGQEQVVRKASISRCPGESLRDSMCSRQGSGLLKIGWLQREYRGACSLQPNTRYYLELETVTGCSVSCDAYLSIPTNGRP